MSSQHHVFHAAMLAIWLPACSISSTSFSPSTTGDDMTGDDAAGGNVPSGDITIRTFDNTWLVGPTRDADVLGIHDGDGAWQAVTGDNGVYKVHVTSDHYGIAVLCKNDMAALVSITERTPSDGPDVDLARCSMAYPTVHLTGSVTGLDPDDRAHIVGNLGAAFVLGNGPGTYATDVLAGTTDLFGVRSDRFFEATSIIRLKGFDLREPADVTFAFVAAEPTTSFGFTAPEAGSVQSDVVTANGRFGLQMAPPTSTSYASVPRTLLDADDLIAVVWEASGNRVSETFTRGIAPIAVGAVDPVVVTPPSLVTTSPYPLITWPFPAATTVLPRIGYKLVINNGDPFLPNYRTWQVDVSQSYALATQTTSYTFPDLGTLTGFTGASHGLNPTGGATYTLYRSEATALTRVDGAETRYAFQSGTVMF